jgi:inorganic pyrophosphatase
VLARRKFRLGKWVLKVFIENEAGSLVKHIHNEKTLELVDTTLVSRPYPLPYGFVLATSAEDGDNVDCFVLTKTCVRTGEIVDCNPIGLLEQIEDGAVDHKVLALICGEIEELGDDIKKSLIEFTNHVFDHVPGKSMTVGEFRGRQAALEHLSQHQDQAAAS